MPDPSIVTTFASGWSLLAIAIIAIATRYLNAYLTSPNAPDWITGGLAAVLAGLGALAAYLTDVKGAGTWQAALAVFVGALATTKAVQATDLGVEPVLKGTKAGLSPARAVGTTIPNSAAAYDLEASPATSEDDLGAPDIQLPDLPDKAG